MLSISLLPLFKKYIKNTSEKDFVAEYTIVLCSLTNEVFGSGLFTSTKVYLTTRMLKHLYDAKPAEEFDFVLNHFVEIVRFPDRIYENKGGKRGGYCFVKRIESNSYICAIEKVVEEIEGVIQESNYIATCFRIRKESYLKDYKLLWSWKGDIPSS